MQGIGAGTERGPVRTPHPFHGPTPHPFHGPTQPPPIACLIPPPNPLRLPQITKNRPFNPIRQDVKKNKLRYVHNVFPHKGYIWNYGALPQTWEDPSHTDGDTGQKGDNDPIDVCDLSSIVSAPGTVKQVKVLGIMAMIDEGETDWKVLAIDVADPLAAELNNVEDIERKLPGYVKATEEWFRIYKIPDGKEPNKFAFNGEARNKVRARLHVARREDVGRADGRSGACWAGRGAAQEYALKVIKETHGAWKKLIAGQATAKDIEMYVGRERAARD